MSKIYGGYGIPGQGEGRHESAQWREHISEGLKGKHLTALHREDISKGEKASYERRFGRASSKKGSKKGSKKSRKSSKRQNGGYGIPGQGRGRHESAEWREHVSEGQKESYLLRFGHPARSRSRRRSRKQDGGYGIPGQGRGRHESAEWREHISEGLKGNQNARGKGPCELGLRNCRPKK
jgi:hypothetical protein